MTEQLPPAALLEGLMVGEPISSHHGVLCYPAIRENTDEKYIIKIVTIPASLSQLDALLLTGACADEDQALSYFRELADGVADEAALLQRLSTLEGFKAYLGCEVQPSAQGFGYDVCLLSPYKPTLAKLMKDAPLTHLAAVNLGLDLCAALTACRRLGYLYADLRPENVFFSENHGYRIGDLGFISLASLPYASLPEKYRSHYTAPEISDAMSSLNDTMDIYSLGLVLYQVYNNGQLPFDGSAPAKVLPTPLYADYEMAEIILKACAPDPKDRWQDPTQMGQALVNYMQRNSVNATPIIPAPILTEEPEDTDEDFLSEEENDAELADLLAQLPEEVVPEQLAMDGTSQSLTVPEQPESEKQDILPSSENDEGQLSFLDALVDDETAPSGEASAALNDTGVTEEVAQMLAMADDLIAHELPEPVVAPGPIDVPIPPVIIDEPVEEEKCEEPTAIVPTEDEPASEESAEEETVPYDTEDEYIYDLPDKPKSGRWITLTTTILLFLAIAVGGYIWYQTVFIKTVDALTIQGDGNALTVTLVTDIDEKLLTVICTDTYGNTLQSPVVGGVATFTELTASSQYRIRVEISGLHKLTGNITGLYTTEAQTEILNFSAVCGPEDGSAILNFAVNGPDVDQWTLSITAPGEAERIQDFTGHTVTVYDLKPGTQYTFTLEGATDSVLAGQNTITYTAQAILCAENLQVTACGEGSLTVQWTQPDAPAGQVWTLRCYNEAGYDQTVTTTDLSYTFTDLDHSTGYTVLVTADGMPQSASVCVSANPINVTGYSTTGNAYSLTVQWEFTGNAPENGWVLVYKLNGGQECTLPCQENRAELALVSNGVYEFTARPADDTTCFTQNGSYTAEELPPFEGFGITAGNLTGALVLRPDTENWGYTDLTSDSYKTEFSAGETAAVLLRVGTNFTLSKDEISVTFVVRDANALLISAESEATVWRSLWQGVYCPLDLPAIPTEPGSYIFDLYFREQLVTSLQFNIV